MASKKESGAFFFDAFYKDIFNERWQALKASLLQEHTGIPLSHEGFPSYFLDEGSIAAACALPLDNASCILDVCAAPGGKTLVMSHFLSKNSTITANELSGERRTRLVKVLDEHVPENIRSRITVTPYDGSIMYKKNMNIYDAVLLDAPCSSERHVLGSAVHLSQWTKARIRNLTYTQWSLLSASFLMLKDGGCLLYSTCALAPEENDGVIQKLCKKYDTAQVISVDCDTIKAKVASLTGRPSSINPERTDFGFHILPDTSSGCGPLFFSLIKKEASCK